MKFFFMSFDILDFLTGFQNSQVIGGAEKQQFLLINELMRRGHTVLTCTNYDALPEAIRYNILRYPSERKYLKYILVFLRLLRFNPDVVYLRSPSNIGLTLCLYTFFFRKKMVFFSAHDTDFEPSINLQGYNEYLFSFFTKLVDLFFVQNAYQANLLKSHFGRESILFGNIIAVRNDPARIAPNARKYFLWVGRVERFKRLELLCEIAAMLPHENFIVIGPSRETNAYSQSILKRIAAIKNIQYIPFVDPGQIDKFFSMAKGLICTSEYEGFPNTFLEAWNNSTPVYSLGVDPNGIIAKAKGKLGYVFASKDDLVNRIPDLVKLQDLNYMYQYLKNAHSLEANVDLLLRKVSE